MTDLPALESWLIEAFAPDRRIIYKRLSGNDTGATGSHQVGPYIPNKVALAIAPELDDLTANPRRSIRLRLISHGEDSTPTLIHYNNRLTGSGTRDECRITGFGGKSSSFQKPDNTGSVLVVSFDGDGESAEAWIAKDLDEEAAIEDYLGPIEPGVVGFVGADSSGHVVSMEIAGDSPVWSEPISGLPANWAAAFPSPADLSGEAIRRVPASGLSADARLMRRHGCEFAMFRTVEAHHLTPILQRGFPGVPEFLALAQSTLQRRKARAGLSLERQIAQIFGEEGVLYEAQKETEAGNVPDFLFPSLERYRTAAVGSPDLAILAVKSTLRDRWRQVLREASKVPVKHLFTLEEGLSERKFAEIVSSGIRIVVPAARITAYPKNVRSDLLTLGSFIHSRINSQ